MGINFVRSYINAQTVLHIAEDIISADIEKNSIPETQIRVALFSHGYKINGFQLTILHNENTNYVYIAEHCRDGIFIATSSRENWEDVCETKFPFSIFERFAETSHNYQAAANKVVDEILKKLLK